MKNLKISLKLMIGFLSVTVLTIIVGVVGIYGLLTASKTSSNMYEIQTVPMPYMSKVIESMQRLRVNVRQYVVEIIAENPAGVEETHNLIEQFKRDVTENLNLFAATISNDEVLAIFEEARGLLNTEYAPHLDRAYQMALEGDYMGIIGELDNARAITNIIVANFDRCMDIKINDAADANEANNAMTTRLLTIIGVILFFSIVASLILAFYISGLISKPIGKLVDVAKNVAHGNLNVNIDATARDESGMLANGFSDVVGAVNLLITDIKEMYRVFNNEGDIEARLDSTKFNGAYREVTENINNLIGSIVNDALLELRLLEEFGKGDFSIEIPKMPGKKIVMNQTVDKFKDTINSINSGINALTQDVTDGKLSSRINADNYTGEWSQLMKGLNHLMDEVSAPSLEISNVMKHVADGDFNSKMNGNYKGDFLTLQNAINTTVTNIASYIDEISSVLRELSQNNFNQEISRQYVGSFSHIKDAVNSIINTFNEMLGNISSAAEQVSIGARSISESSMTMATGASEQAASVEQLNATILTINESTSRNSESAKNAEGLSVHSKENAAIGDADMKNMLVSMDGIKESSNKISNIIKVIEDIAFQTNLLALNAAVEAARAGEHGKGFAVVAEEVRTLASRSQEAAKETSALIEESIERVGEGTKIADKTADALRTIVGDIGKIADIISNIATASHEQSEATSQATQGLSEITEVVQNNSATSEESAAASQQLSGQAELLHNLVSVFKLKR